MSAHETLLAAWKLGLSFIKRNWKLTDYPVVIREQKVESESQHSPSRGVQQRYLARIVNWWVMTGGGSTPQEAMTDLMDHFDRMKGSRSDAGKPMPRRGTKAPIEFAPSTRIDVHRELADDFIRRVLGLDWAFVSDQSSLWDFHTNATNAELNARIKELYGVDVFDLESGNLAEIFERIAARQTG